ncbi:MAG: hypothetical protein AABW71_05030 [Nanoarchaeota archaeon]
MNTTPIYRGSEIKVLDDVCRLDWSKVTGRRVLSATEASRLDVGVSFELRTQINYNIVYDDGETEHRRVLLVLKKDETTVVYANLDYKI